MGSLRHRLPHRATAGALPRVVEPAAGRRIKWRELGFMFLAAAVMVLATLWMGLDEGADAPFIAALAGTGAVCGLALVALPPALPTIWMVPVLAFGVVLVSGGVMAVGEPDSPYTLIYVWVGVMGWFFLRPLHAAVAMVFTALAAAVVMLAIVPEGDDADAGAWWIVVTGSLLAMSALAGILHARARRLILELEDVAVRDPLTGLLNRRGYQQRLAEELARARRDDTPLSIVLGDLDGFKLLNDRHGHRFGDAALQQFAGVCMDQKRGYDFVSRVGGEEFALVLPGTAEHGAVLVAERLRRAVRERLPAAGGAPITASFGVATFPQHGVDGEVLLDHADQAMYAAKAMGRDRTVAFAPGLTSGRGTAQRSEQTQAVVLLAETLDLRDAATARHSQTVAGLAERIASALRLAPAHVARIRLAGLLHDVGKIGVPDQVLGKPGPLTAPEWAEMRKHPELGARIVAGAGLEDVAAWVLSHHERPDGGGYPDGRTLDRIPLESRILAVADAYEAMTADRPYRAAMAEADALAELARGAGTQFDADVVAAFLAGAPAARSGGTAREPGAPCPADVIS